MSFSVEESIVFGLPGGDIYVLQQRSPVLKVILFYIPTTRTNGALELQRSICRGAPGNDSLKRIRLSSLSRRFRPINAHRRADEVRKNDTTITPSLRLTSPSSAYYHILAKDTTPDSILATSLGSLLGLPTLNPSPNDDATVPGPVIPGAGLARRLLAAHGSVPPRIALVQFVAEGDNIPDAHAMASMVANTLKSKIQGP